MAKIVGTGTLVDAADVGVMHSLEGMHASLFGVLLSGTFGSPTGDITFEVRAQEEPNAQRTIAPFQWNAFKTQFRCQEVGLYTITCNLTEIQLHLDNGEAGVTDIDYVIFVQERP